MLNPAILLSSARTVPRCFLLKAKYCCSVNVAFIHAYLSARLWPVNSISALPLRNPRIPSGVSVCTFSIRISIHLVAWQTHNFTIILYWKQAPFQDHLVLDNSDRHGRECLCYDLRDGEVSHHGHPAGAHPAVGGFRAAPACPGVSGDRVRKRDRPRRRQCPR